MAWVSELLPPSLQKESAKRQLDYLLDDLALKFAQIDVKTWNKLCKDSWLRNHPQFIQHKKENPYNVFVKEHYAEVKQSLDKTKKREDVLRRLGELWRFEKSKKDDLEKENADIHFFENGEKDKEKGKVKSKRK